MQYQKITKKELAKTIVCIILVFMVVIIGPLIFLPDYGYIGAGLQLIGIYAFLKWHTKNYAYLCPNCGYVFQISIIRFLISQHTGLTSCILKCPRCKQLSDAMVVKKNI